MPDIELLKKYGYVPEPATVPFGQKNEKVDLEQYGYVPPESEEGLGKSVLMAIPRVGYDLGNSILERIRQIPAMAQSAPKEVPAYIQGAFGDHPKHFIGQQLAGANEAINTIAQSPLNLAKYLNERLHLVPDSLPAGMKALVPEDTTQAIHETFGEPKYPGEALGRSILRNLPEIVPLGGAALKFNPAKLTSKNIAGDVMHTRNEMRNLYNERYENFLDEAHANQLGYDLPNVAWNIDLQTAMENEPRRVHARINEFENNPNVRTAHEAKKDLLKIQRKLNSKNETQGLIGNEPAKLDAVNDAIGQIEGGMFTDATGAVNPEFANAYRQLQRGYASDVLPYTKNKAINEFNRGERLPDQLVKSLMSGKFPAQRGHAHPALMTRRSLGNHPLLTKALGLTSAGGLAALLYKALSAENPQQ